MSYQELMKPFRVEVTFYWGRPMSMSAVTIEGTVHKIKPALLVIEYDKELGKRFHYIPAQLQGEDWARLAAQKRLWAPDDGTEMVISIKEIK